MPRLPWAFPRGFLSLTRMELTFHFPVESRSGHPSEGARGGADVPRHGGTPHHGAGRDEGRGPGRTAAQDALAPAPLPPHLRHASPRAWRRPIGDPGSARARVGGHDRDLYAGEFSATAAGDSGVGRAFTELGVLYPPGVPIT